MITIFGEDRSRIPPLIVVRKIAHADMAVRTSMGLSNSQPVTVEASFRSVILQTRINSRFPLATTHTAGLGWYSMCEGEFNLWPKHRAGRAHGMALFVVVGLRLLAGHGGESQAGPPLAVRP